METITRIFRTVEKRYLFPLVLLAALLAGQNALFGQTEEQRVNLQRFAERAGQEFQKQKAEAIRIADSLGLPVRTRDESGRVTELMRFEHRMPVYYITTNLGGAKTISTNQVWSGGSAGLALDGSGEILRIWDEGAVRATHQELNGRVTISNPVSNSDHATHVAGTMIAAGISANARGMANQSTLQSFDWNNDAGEMAAEAAGGMLVSNHSYGIIAGWAWGKWYNSAQPAAWHWWGIPAINPNQDYKFGFYDSTAMAWDEIAGNAPNYLIVKSAGNDRGQGPSVPGTSHYIWNGGWVLSATPRPKDGGADGFDCIPAKGVAKNILTVGAIHALPNGYNQPNNVIMSDFSGWGPTDDGRIKPDLVAKGVDVYSTLAFNPVSQNPSNNSYDSWDGTSMAAPMVTGSVALLNQHYKNTHNNAIMRSATMKALLIHTADEAGTATGPDYKHGWGVMNTKNAAQVIADNAADTGLPIREMTLAKNEVIELRIWPKGNEPLKATLVWTDPAGTPPAPSLNPPDLMLVNDLDMRIIELTTSTVYSPYVLDPQNPSAAATTGDNFRDNVEQIDVSNLPAVNCPQYVIRISHKGQLTNDKQDFSLIITGIEPSQIIFVKKGASGNNNGTSWDDAFTNLQDGINAASHGDQVWVAKGTYYPTGNGGARHRHFNLKNCVEIYGGFAGDEDVYTFPLHHRNLLDNETILHGEKNRYHVVRSYPGIDETAVLDGVTVTAGYADCMLDPSCDETVDDRGAGMYNRGNPTIRNSTFTANYALTYGGGMLNENCNPTLINCTFNANDLPECGGGLTNHGSNPLLINCLFHGNKANTGGAICNDYGSNPAIINTTISGNFATTKGGGIMSNYWSGSSATLKNSIVWGNEVDVYPYCEGHQLFVGDGNPAIQVFSSLVNNGGNHIFGPVLFDPLCLFVNPLFINPVPAKLSPNRSGNYRLSYASPAIDAGRNLYVPVKQLDDLDWNQRIDSLSKIVDMGAYEWPKECQPPKNLAVKNITDHSAELLWTPGGSENLWEIEYGLKGFAQGTGAFILVVEPSYRLIGLSPDTEYEYYVRGLCPPAFVSEWAGPKPFKTLEPCDPPMLFTATAGATDVTLTWVEPIPAPQLGYEINIHDMNGNLIFDVYVAPGTSSFSINGLLPVTDYLATIRSDCGNGSYSLWESVYFSTPLPNCDPPSNLTALATAATVELNWTEPVPAPQMGYEIEIFDINGNVVSSGTTPAGANSFTFAGLVPASYYFAQVVSNCGSGLYSVPAQVTFYTCTQFTVTAPADFKVCIDVQPFALAGGTPAGGTYTGNGVNAAGVFSPFDVGAGAHLITYTYTDVLGCSGSATFIITVDALPAVACPPGFSVCITDLPFALAGANPVGGTYSGPGVAAGIFSPAQATTGAHIITYQYTDPVTGCTGKCDFMISVNPTPFVTCPNDMVVCVNDVPFALAGGAPVGGVYAGTGVAGGIFNPGNAGPGTHLITYTYTDPLTNCTDTCDFNIVVKPLPIVTCPANINKLVSDPPFVLFGGAPAGGIYTNASGTPVVVFNPAVAGIGNHKITYTYTDNHGCASSCDFFVIVSGSIPNQYDFGDAPDGPYPTLYISGGAYHLIDGYLFMGNFIDSEPNGQPTINADGDDSNGIDDEDGVTFTTALEQGQVATVEVVVSAWCKLNAWIDYNQINGWSDAGEHVFVDVILSPGLNVLSFTVPSTAVTGDTYARFRVNYNGGISYDGYGYEGEVEDYKVSVLPPSVEFDFGDAPENPQLGFYYPTTLANNGARHLIDPAVYLGDLIDSEPDGQPTITALGDDLNNLDDEDGVLFVRRMAVGTMARVRVKASVTGYLNTWIDFNRNGTWSDAGEQIFTDQILAPGWNILNFMVPAGSTPGRAYARFRFNTTGGLSYDGLAQDGEVEDYRVNILPPNWAFTITNSSHLVAVPLSLGISTLAMSGVNLFPGDFVGAFFTDQNGNEVCGGAVLFDGEENQVLFAYGDDPLTSEKDGFAEGESFKFKVFRTSTGEEFAVNAQFDPGLPNADGRFYDNGLSGLIGLAIPAIHYKFMIPEGWSGVSTWYQPADPFLSSMLAPELNKLVILYNQQGIFWPGVNLNTLMTWDAYSGYIAKATGEIELMLEANELFYKSVWLNAGWNLIPVIIDDLVDIYSLVSGLNGFVLLKEVAGTGVFWPQYGINTIGFLEPGKAYYLLTNVPGTLDFEGAPPASITGMNTGLPVVNSPWPEPAKSPITHLVLFNLSESDLQIGDIVGAFSEDGRCVGVCALADANLPFALAIFGDDPYDQRKTGLYSDEPFILKVYRSMTEETFDLEVVFNPQMSDGIFMDNGLSEVTGLKLSLAAMPQNYSINLNIYPNPSSGIFNISGIDANAKVSVFNNLGTEVSSRHVLLSGQIDLTGQPDGIYMIRIQSGDSVRFVKVIKN